MLLCQDGNFARLHRNKARAAGDIEIDTTIPIDTAAPVPADPVYPLMDVVGALRTNWGGEYQDTVRSWSGDDLYYTSSPPTARRRSGWAPPKRATSTARA